MTAARRVAVVTTVIVGVLATRASAQSADNVAIVINELSEDSQAIGAHYVRVRKLPESNIFRVRTSTNDAISRAEYVESIERPLALAIGRAGLQDRILYLVLTKGVPLRITGTTGLAGTTASVDSELTLVYRRLAGNQIPSGGMVDNPYFLGAREPKEAKPFTHRAHDIYLVTRLDAFTAAEAIALIDRAQTVKPAGTVVLDQRAAPDSRAGDEWLRLAHERLAGLELANPVVLETTPKPASTADPVLGLFTWGAGDPAHRTRRAGMSFVPGAIAANLASFDARTFRTPPENWQPTASSNRSNWFEDSADALIGDLIRDGVTGVAGQVGEAYARGAVRPDILFPAYLSGLNLAESFYLAIPGLSWQTVVIGDPLTTLAPERRLSATELEDRVDPATGMPAFFAERRIAAIAASNRDVPTTAIIPMLRALGLLQRDDKPAAAQSLAEAVRLSPGVAGWLTSLGSLQEQAADYDGAIATYQQALKFRPDNIVALNNLAFALAVYAGKPADAKPFAETAVALDGRSGTILDTLAWIEHLLENNSRASQLLADAIRLSPKQPEIRLHAAIVYAALGQSEKAQTELAEALRLDPSLESRDEVRKLRK